MRPVGVGARAGRRLRTLTFGPISPRAWDFFLFMLQLLSLGRRMGTVFRLVRVVTGGPDVASAEVPGRVAETDSTIVFVEAERLMGLSW